MTQISDYKAQLLQSTQGVEEGIGTGAERLRALASDDDRIKELIARLSNPDTQTEDQINALNDLKIISNFSKTLPTYSAEIANALRGMMTAKDPEVRQQALSYLALTGDAVALQHLRDELQTSLPEAEKSVPTSQAIAMLSVYEKGVDKVLLLDVVKNPPDNASLVEAVRHLPADEETADALVALLEDAEKPIAARALVPDLVNKVDPDTFAKTAQRILEDEGSNSEIAPYLARGAASIQSEQTTDDVNALKSLIESMATESGPEFKKAAELLERSNGGGADK